MTGPEASRLSAATAYPEVFKQTDAIIEQFHQWIDRDIPNDATWWGIVRVAILVRAFNQYRSIVNLLRDNHWEDSLILVRSLFELLLNTEELCRHTDNIEETAEGFAAYGHLQSYLKWRELQLYYLATGREGPELQKRVDEMDALARKFFAPFWETGKKGRAKWRERWSKKSVTDLCALSSNPLRKHQYRLLYGRGSDFTHSSPVAVFAATRITGEPEELADQIRWADSQEEKELRDVASIASIFLLEIALLIGDRLPDFDLLWIVNVGPKLVGGILGVALPSPTIWPVCEPQGTPDGPSRDSKSS